MEIAHSSSRIAGPLIFLGAAYLFGRRLPQRNALQFTAAFCVAYAAITIGMLVPMGTLEAAFKEGMVLSMGLKFLGALIGALLARRRPASTRSV